MESFKEGYTCECGETIDERNVKTKTRCTSKEALENHVIFPTFSLLDKVQTLVQHWVLFVEIETIQNDKSEAMKAASDGIVRWITGFSVNL